MTEGGHEHCWHVTDRRETTAGLHISKICCKCGVVRNQTFPPIPAQKYTYDESEHGPFAPHRTVRYD